MKKKLRFTSKHLLLLVLGVYDCQNNIINAARIIIAKIEKLNVKDVGLTRVYEAFVGLIYDTLNDEEREIFYKWYRASFESIEDIKSFIISSSTCLYVKFYGRRLYMIFLKCKFFLIIFFLFSLLFLLYPADKSFIFYDKGDIERAQEIDQNINLSEYQHLLKKKGADKMLLKFFLKFS